MLHIYDILLDTHRGNPTVKIYFSGEGIHKKGRMYRLRDVVDEVLKFPTNFVLITGGEPLAQHMRMLIGLCNVLRRIYKKKIILETNGTRFNQLLFINIKHFVVHPHKEEFVPDRFQRYIDHAEHKNLLKFRTPDISFTDNRCTRLNYGKFVELCFDLRSSGDAEFFVNLIRDYDIKGQKIKVFINPQPSPEFTISQIMEEWIAHKDKIGKYIYLYMMEGSR